MTGQLQTHGHGGGLIPCALCGGEAAGPCGRCRKPVCGDCCVLTEGTAGKWAICLNCNRRGGRAVGSGWWVVAVWLALPLVVLVALLALLQLVWG